MSDAVTYTQHFIMCPHCGMKSGCRIDHLFDKRAEGYAWGPWYCGACGGAFRGNVGADNAVTVEALPDRQKKRRSMVLLKLEAGERRVFFVMDNPIWGDDDLTTEGGQSHIQYFFEEHSCPTNWLRDCVAVIEDDDMDPHGFLEFVRAVEVPIGLDVSPDPWRELFPEAFEPKP